MIFKEFALQPELLSRFESCRFWLSLFGLEKGRQISRYPKRWKKLVYEATPSARPREKKAIEERLRKLPNSIFRVRDHVWDPNPSVGWLNNAIDEHRMRPFRAIIADVNGMNKDFIIEGNEDDEQHELLQANPSTQIIRDLEGLTSWVAPLLEQSSKIVIVDPFFSPTDPAHLRPLKKIFEIINQRQSGCSEILLEYHSRDTIGGTDEWFIEKCNENLSHIRPENISIEFYRWESHKIHNRFLLSKEYGGVMYGHGLGESSHNSSDIDEILYLSQDAYESRWEQYANCEERPLLVLS